MALSRLVCTMLLLLASTCRPTTSFRLLRAASVKSRDRAHGRRSLAATIPTSLWQLIDNREDLSILKQLVQGAGLVEQLNRSSTGMFLPSDGAFNSYMEETGLNLTDLTGLAQTGNLTTQLLYHLCNNSALTNISMHMGQHLAMGNGGNVTLENLWDSRLYVRDAAGRASRVAQSCLPVEPNIRACIVDRVLVPRRPATVEEALTSNAQLSSFLRAMRVGGYNATLKSQSANMTFLVPTNQVMENKLASMNLTLNGLLENHTVLTGFVSSHILTGAFSWATLNQYEFEYSVSDQSWMWFDSYNSCSRYLMKRQGNGQLLVEGFGVVVNINALITDSDLIAGEVAVMHLVDDLFVPASDRAGTVKCRMAGQSP